MTKRLVVCFDGTWNRPDKDKDEIIEESNVARIYRSILGEDTSGIMTEPQSQNPSVRTVKWYDPGVGTQWGEMVRGSLFGFGLSKNVQEGYQFLVNNYSESDEIYLIGFSRGAYTARSLAGLIRKIGLMKKEHAPADTANENPILVNGYELYRQADDTPDTQDAEDFKQKHSWPSVAIKLLGVWDTVGSLGIPGEALDWLNDIRYGFHDTRLSRIIENAFHAVAIDEHRDDFEATMWDPDNALGANRTMEQVWFAGAHSDVGGGSSRSALSDITLRWMQEKVQLGGKGLELDASQFPELDPAYLSAKVSDSYKDFLGGVYRIWRRITFRGRNYRPFGKTKHGNESLHVTALEKIRHNRNYNPKNPGIKQAVRQSQL